VAGCLERRNEPPSSIKSEEFVEYFFQERLCSTEFFNFIVFKVMHFERTDMSGNGWLHF
jgi:hypothetical protein